MLHELALTLALRALQGAAAPPPKRIVEIESGTWRAQLASPGGELSFGLDVTSSRGKLAVAIRNGDESIEVPAPRIEGDELVLDMGHYDSMVRAKIAPDGRRMDGEWKKRSGDDRVTRLVFAARRSSAAETSDAPAPAARAASVDGKWAAKFSSSDDPAVGVFRMRSPTRVDGTFLTTTGDYRYLAGTWTDGRLRLACFDGAHAFLFDARLQPDGTLKGDFWSGDRWHETWTATRDANAALPDTYGRAHWNADFGLATLAFPDLDGKERSLADPAFAGKARIIQILGSWCPNCHDETHYLADLYRRDQARGLSIVGIAFELSGDFSHDAQQVRLTRDRHGATYPMLLATATRDKAREALPALGGLFAFPTTIFLHRDGRVRAVHSGFSGPATGEEFSKLKVEFEKIVDELIDEPAPDDSALWKILSADNWRDERDNLVLTLQRDARGNGTFEASEGLRFDRPAKRDPVAHGPVTVDGSTVTIGDSVYHYDKRCEVLLDARDVGHRLTPATRPRFPRVDGTSYFDQEPLLGAVRNADALVRREALVYITLAIQKHELEAAFDPTPALADPEPEVRCAAAWSAGRLNAAAAAPALADCLSHGYAPLRREAARALGKLKAHDSIARLRTLSIDLDPLVREAAADALAKLEAR
jgi:thiol-disulfide isomerase/thioredoxin